MPLDVSSLASVAHFAEQMRERLDSLDILINDAGTGGSVARNDRGRLRACTRHELPWALRADGASATAPEAGAQGPCGQRVQRGALARASQLREPTRAARLLAACCDEQSSCSCCCSGWSFTGGRTRPFSA